MKFVILTFFVFVISASALAKPIDYTIGDKKFQGVLMMSSKKKAPSIVILHNWMGVTDESIKQANRFKDLGYNVFVVDIYGKDTRPKNTEQAAAISNIYKTDRKLLRQRIIEGIEVFKKQKGVNANKIAALGYCFGGTAAMELARSGYDIDGVIAFHGGLDSTGVDEGAKIKTKILAMRGQEDPYMKLEEIMAFVNEMRAHKVNFELITYPYAVHSFTEKDAGDDTSKGAAYNEQADKRSFARAKDFLAEIF